MPVPRRPEDVTEEDLQTTLAVIDMMRDAVEENEPYASNYINALQVVSQSTSHDPDEALYR